MTRQEFSTIAMALKTYYAKEERLLPNQQSMELWFRQLEDLPAKVVETVVNLWVATNKWSPSIADIREKSAELLTGSRQDWGEAWEEVMRSVRAFGSWREKEALQTLDPLTRECVERIGFQSICASENIAVERAHFRDVYNQVYGRRTGRAY